SRGYTGRPTQELQDARAFVCCRNDHWMIPFWLHSSREICENFCHCITLSSFLNSDRLWWNFYNLNLVRPERAAGRQLANGSLAISANEWFAFSFGLSCGNK